MGQRDLAPERLIFIDETWASTNIRAAAAAVDAANVSGSVSRMESARIGFNNQSLREISRLSYSPCKAAFGNSAHAEVVDCEQAAAHLAVSGKTRQRRLSHRGHVEHV